MTVQQLDFLGSDSPKTLLRRISFRQWQLREGNVLYRSGARNMSTTDLLAHLLRDYRVAENLMEHFGDLPSIVQAPVVELKQVKGVSVANAETIQVALALSHRVEEVRGEVETQVQSPQDIYRMLWKEYQGLEQETLKLLLLNTKNKVSRVETVFVGSLNASIIHPREIFKLAIRQSAASIIISHNHPSGDPQPSKEDIKATKQIHEAGQLVQIPLLDHVIFGSGHYISFKEEGLI